MSVMQMYILIEYYLLCIVYLVRMNIFVLFENIYKLIGMR